MHLLFSVFYSQVKITIFLHQSINSRMAVLAFLHGNPSNGRNQNGKKATTSPGDQAHYLMWQDEILENLRALCKHVLNLATKM